MANKDLPELLLLAKKNLDNKTGWFWCIEGCSLHFFEEGIPLSYQECEKKYQQALRDKGINFNLSIQTSRRGQKDGCSYVAISITDYLMIKAIAHNIFHYPAISEEKLNYVASVLTHITGEHFIVDKAKYTISLIVLCENSNFVNQAIKIGQIKKKLLIYSVNSLEEKMISIKNSRKLDALELILNPLVIQFFPKDILKVAAPLIAQAKRNKGSYLNSLPDDIVYQIARYLDPRDNAPEVLQQYIQSAERFYTTIRKQHNQTEKSHNISKSTPPPLPPFPFYKKK